MNSYAVKEGVAKIDSANNSANRTYPAWKKLKESQGFVIKDKDMGGDVSVLKHSAAGNIIDKTISEKYQESLPKVLADLQAQYDDYVREKINDRKFSTYVSGRRFSNKAKAMSDWYDSVYNQFRIDEETAKGGTLPVVDFSALDASFPGFKLIDVITEIRTNEV